MFLAFCYKTIWQHHIDALIKIVIQECGLDIHLSYFVIEMCYNGLKYSNGLKHDYQQEGLLTVETRFLTITFCDKPSLKSFNISIYNSFFFL